MDNQKAVLYDTYWQKLRVSTLAKYSPEGGWNTVQGVRNNIRKFTEYLEDAESAQEQMYRAWRVLNMLNAIRMGYYGQGLQTSEQDQLVTDFRDSGVRPLYIALQDEGHEFEDWDWVKEEEKLRALKQKDPMSFARIQNNLQGRHDFTMKKMQTDENRPELVKYLELMNKV